MEQIELWTGLEFGPSKTSVQPGAKLLTLSVQSECRISLYMPTYILKTDFIKDHLASFFNNKRYNWLIPVFNADFYVLLAANYTVRKTFKATSHFSSVFSTKQ